MTTEAQERMDRLVVMLDVNNIQNSCEFILEDLLSDGFEAQEIFEYIVLKIKAKFAEEGYGVK